MLGGTEFEYCRIFVSRKMEGFTGSDDVLEILDRLQRADLEIKRDVKKLHEMEKHNQEQEVLILQVGELLNLAKEWLITREMFKTEEKTSKEK